MLSDVIRVDLHIHSDISGYKEATKEVEDDITGEKRKINLVENSNIDNIEVLLDKLEENGINLFAFSNHNRFDKNLFLKAKSIINEDKSKEKPRWPHIMNVLASIEFDVLIEDGKNPCHIVTVFDYKNENDLDNIRDAVNYDKDDFSGKEIISKFGTKLITKKDEAYTLKEYEDTLRAIKLSTILIVHQKRSLDSDISNSKSLSDSTSDPYVFLKVGFISALEYQNSKIEGIIRENLKDFEIPIPLVTGSDCHVWDVYPLHDKTSTSNKTFCFEIKSLPTFLGLQLAMLMPKTRFRRSSAASSYVKSFSINGKIIELDAGLNVIIGENGSGKSTLLAGIENALGRKYNTDELRYVPKLLKMNDFKLNKIKLKPAIVNQNDIITKNNDEKMFYEDFAKNDNTIFKNSIKTYSEELLKYIDFNINKSIAISKLKELKAEISPDKYYNESFYISIVSNDFDKNTKTQAYKNSYDSLNGILSKLRLEYIKELYSAEEKDRLKNAINELTIVNNNILMKLKQSVLEDKTKNTITLCCADYCSKIDDLSNENDAKSANYKKEINQFVKAIVKYINNYVFKDRILPKLDTSGINGKSFKHEKGFNFITETNYYSLVASLDTKFREKIFNSAYIDLENLKKIDTVEELVQAIKNAGSDNYKTIYESSTSKFITDMCKEHKYITVGEKTIGNTLGEKSLVYYKYLSNEINEYDILLIDQPEDNISNVGINRNLLNHINSLRGKKQVIFVTHNPLLVVNLDVDNVIVMSNINSKFNIESGCLEDEGILENVASMLDGGKEAIEKRLKIYYGK